jgi:NTP pyrophosphatase (non-canonical NTP hydrolase)
MLNELSKQIHDDCIEKGWYTEKDVLNIGERLCLIHSEVSEALEADRKNQYCNLPELLKDLTVEGKYSDRDFQHHFRSYFKGRFEEEMADIIIRTLDMCAYKGIDIESFIAIKMRWNKLQPGPAEKKY